MSSDRDHLYKRMDRKWIYVYIYIYRDGSRRSMIQHVYCILYRHIQSFSQPCNIHFVGACVEANLHFLRVDVCICSAFHHIIHFDADSAFWWSASKGHCLVPQEFTRCSVGSTAPHDAMWCHVYVNCRTWLWSDRLLLWRLRVLPGQGTTTPWPCSWSESVPFPESEYPRNSLHPLQSQLLSSELKTHPACTKQLD